MLKRGGQKFKYSSVSDSAIEHYEDRDLEQPDN